MSRTDKDRPYLVKVYDFTYLPEMPRSARHYHHPMPWQRGWTPEKGGPTGECDLWSISITDRLRDRHDRRGGAWCTLWLHQSQGAYKRGSDSSKKIGRRIKRRNTRQWCHEARYDPELDGPPQFPNMTGEKWWDW